MVAVSPQLQCFSADHDFYRFADQNRRRVFTQLASLPRFHWQVRANGGLMIAFLLHLVVSLGVAFEVQDGAGMPTVQHKGGEVVPV